MPLCPHSSNRGTLAGLRRKELHRSDNTPLVWESQDTLAKPSSTLSVRSQRGCQGPRSTSRADIREAAPGYSPCSGGSVGGRAANFRPTRSFD